MAKFLLQVRNQSQYSLGITCIFQFSFMAPLRQSAWYQLPAPTLAKWPARDPTANLPFKCFTYLYATFKYTLYLYGVTRVTGGCSVTECGIVKIEKETDPYL